MPNTQGKIEQQKWGFCSCCCCCVMAKFLNHEEKSAQIDIDYKNMKLLRSTLRRWREKNFQQHEIIETFLQLTEKKCNEKKMEKFFGERFSALESEKFLSLFRVSITPVFSGFFSIRNANEHRKLLKSHQRSQRQVNSSKTSSKTVHDGSKVARSSTLKANERRGKLNKFSFA